MFYFSVFVLSYDVHINLNNDILLYDKWEQDYTWISMFLFLDISSSDNRPRRLYYEYVMLINVIYDT